VALGKERREIVTHSDELHDKIHAASPRPWPTCSVRLNRPGSDGDSLVWISHATSG
jgi:hypothetical protein